MIIRSMSSNDIQLLHKLSARHYPEFHCPDFNGNYLNTFVITDDNGEVILGGGLRDIAEVILVTDKLRNKHEIGEALLKALSHSVNTARMRNIDFLYAFVKDYGYKKHLISHGFDPIEGEPLSLWVKNGS